MKLIESKEAQTIYGRGDDGSAGAECHSTENGVSCSASAGGASVGVSVSATSDANHSTTYSASVNACYNNNCVEKTVSANDAQIGTCTVLAAGATAMAWATGNAELAGAAGTLATTACNAAFGAVQNSGATPKPDQKTMATPAYAPSPLSFGSFCK
jgi:hypothetical protein